MRMSSAPSDVKSAHEGQDTRVLTQTLQTYWLTLKTRSGHETSTDVTEIQIQVG